MNVGQAITQRAATVNGVRLNYRTAGQGDPVVLIHGWPESSYTWRKVMPSLAARYTVIAPDMRGCGDSEKPATGYDKRTIAEDIYQLVRQLGYERIYLVAADMGGPVGYRFAAEHPEMVRRFVFIESGVPGFGLEQAMDVSKAPAGWHFGFNMAGEISETLVKGKEREFLTYFYSRGTQNREAITEADTAEYVRVHTQPGAMRASFEFYRTLLDDGKENRRLFAGKKLLMPVLAIGARQGLGGFSEAAMREVATNVRAVMIERCGHFLQEDQPAELTRHLLAFFDEERR